MKENKTFKKINHRNFPCGPVLKTLLPRQGVWFRSLVGKLRSHMLSSAARNKQQAKKANRIKRRQGAKFFFIRFKKHIVLRFTNLICNKTSCKCKI